MCRELKPKVLRRLAVSALVELAGGWELGARDEAKDQRQVSGNRKSPLSSTPIKAENDNYMGFLISFEFEFSTIPELKYDN